MVLLELVLSGLRKLSTLLAVLAGSAVFVLAFLIAFDVVARRFWGFSLQGTDEIGGYVLAIVASLGFALVLFERGFTRIDLLIARLPRPAVRVLDVAAYVSLAAVAVFFAQRALLAYSDTWRFDTHVNSPLQTPLWIPQGIWVVGMGFFALCAVLYALRAVVLLFTEPEALSADYGTVSLAEEVNEITRVSTAALKDDDARGDR